MWKTMLSFAPDWLNASFKWVFAHIGKCDNIREVLPPKSTKLCVGRLAPKLYYMGFETLNLILTKSFILKYILGNFANNKPFDHESQMDLDLEGCSISYRVIVRVSDHDICEFTCLSVFELEISTLCINLKRIREYTCKMYYIVVT